MNIERMVDRVAEEVLDRGKVKKQEILLRFEVPTDDYADLCKLVIERYRGQIKYGAKGRGGGGLRVVHERRGRPKTVETRDCKPIGFIMEPWETAVVDWCDEHLTRRTLENLLRAYAATLRKLINVLSGQDRRGTKRELATALLLVHGCDLLATKAIRDAFGKAVDVEAPQNWHAGKGAASRFVKDCGLPEELVGVLSPDRQPDIERLEGRVRLLPLQPFQESLKADLRERLKAGGACRCIATLPTGAGKTRVAVELLRDHWADTSAYPAGVIWLAHTDELCEQAFQCVKEVWENGENAPPITAIRYWGTYSRDDTRRLDAVESISSGHALVVSTPVRLLNALTDPQGEDLAHALVSSTRIVVIDEAHRAGAPTYMALANHMRTQNPSVAFVGLTATPYRTEYSDSKAGIARLQQLFVDLVEAAALGSNPRQWLQNERILANIEMREIGTDVTIGGLPESVIDPFSEIPIEQQEATDQTLGAWADRHERRLNILPCVLDVCRATPEASVLYFGPTVQDAQAMTLLLRAHKINAAVVSGNTRTPLRRQIIAAFKRGDIQVLCNCEVLTTGFDAPRVTHLMIARPTVSQVMWEQMLGRGLRGPKFGGTETCLVYDFVDNFSGNEGKVKGFLEYRRAWRKDWS